MAVPFCPHGDCRFQDLVYRHVELLHCALHAGSCQRGPTGEKNDYMNRVVLLWYALIAILSASCYNWSAAVPFCPHGDRRFQDLVYRSLELLYCALHAGGCPGRLTGEINSLLPFHLHDRSAAVPFCPHGDRRFQDLVYRSLELLYCALHAGGCPGRLTGEINSLLPFHLHDRSAAVPFCPHGDRRFQDLGYRSLELLYCALHAGGCPGRLTGEINSLLPFHLHDRSAAVPFCPHGDRRFQDLVYRSLELLYCALHAGGCPGRLTGENNYYINEGVV